MKRLLFIMMISVILSACGRDFKSPTQDTEPVPDYLSDTAQYGQSGTAGDRGIMAENLNK